MIRCRSLLLLVACLSLLLTPFPSRPTALAAASNPIVAENLQPGSDGWRIGRAGHYVANDVSKQIKGYASRTSVEAGQSLDFHVTVSPTPQTYTLDIYRIGWYGGKGGRLMRHVGPLRGVTQPRCPMNSTTGLLQCSWSRGYRLWVPSTWTSGVYVAVLTNQRLYQNYVVFAVRDDVRVADFLYQQSVLTYQAYNKYPDDGATGKSLYPNRSWGRNTVTGERRAVMVSFDRPYHGNGAGEFFFWEVNFIHWLERTGYNVAYSTGIDTHVNGAKLLDYDAWLSVGHDEYWTSQQYDAVRRARASGVHLGFFGANDAYWQVRLARSSAGVPNRVVVCYKDARLDPIETPKYETVRWRQLGRPEQELIGIQFGGILSVADGGKPYVIRNSGNWVYESTGFRNGDAVDRILGPEADRLYSDVPLPAYRSYTLLSHSPYTNPYGSSYGNSSIYQSTSGAWVFASGAWRWSWALDRAGYVDTRIQRATVNLLDRFRGARTASSSVYRTLETRGVYAHGTVMGEEIFAPDHEGEHDR